MRKSGFLFVWFLLWTGLLPAQQVLHVPEKTDAIFFEDTGRVRQMIRSAMGLRTAFPDSAMGTLRRAVLESARAGDTDGMIYAMITLSNLLVRTGAYNQAVEILHETVTISSASGQKRYLSTIYNNLASTYRTLGDYEQAARCYFQAILFAEKFSSTKSRGLIYSNLSTVLMQLGRTDQALYYLDKAEERSRYENNFELVASILIHKGVFYAQQQHWEKSRFYYQTALEAGRKQTQPAYREVAIELQHTALVNLALLYQRKNQPGQALPYLLEALSINSELNAYHRNTVFTALGEVYLKLKDYPHAADYLIRAQKAAVAYNLTNDLIQVYKAMADLYAETGRHKEAFAMERLYITLKDSVEGQDIVNSISRLEAQYRSSEKDKDLIQGQLRIARQEKHMEAQRSWTLGITALAVILILSLVGLYRNNRHKQRLQAGEILNLQQEQEIGKLKAVMQGEEQERVRIARELHDGIGGMLAAVHINLGTFQKQYQGLAGMDDLDRIAAMLRDTSAEVRKSAHNLLPDNLVKFGLTESLRLYCDQINAGKQVQLDLQCLGLLDSLDQSAALTVYRMLQEFVQNIIRHAKAAHASIQLRLQEDELFILIEDDGRGFDLESADSGLGLRNIYERVEALGGRISIESVKGNGTIACVELDLREFNGEDNTNRGICRSKSL